MSWGKNSEKKEQAEDSKGNSANQRTSKVEISALIFMIEQKL